MDKRRISWRAVLAYNARFAGGVIILAYGWLCWHWASPEWRGLYLIGLICLLGGSVHMIGTLIDLIKLWRKTREWNRFQEQGVAPKADALADRKRLKDGGLIK